MLRPIYLQPGDKVALVSPSGITTKEQLDAAAALLASWELIPVPGEHVLARDGRMAGTDEERLADLQAALDAEDVRAIWCMAGDYGILRIIEDADYSVFQGNPKWVIGMNDITVLHSKLHSLGIESLHASMPSNLQETTPEALTQLRNFLFGIISAYATKPHPLNRTGLAEAELIGGMLTWIHSLHDTRIERDTRGTILFLEDPTDDIYRIDRSIRCMKYAGKFQHLAGLAVGEFGRNDDPEFKERVYHIIHDAVKDYAYPVCFGLPAGHTRGNYPLILGTNAELIVQPNGGELKFP
ncbi:LD-carboxypeptidase [Butyricimonas sp.]|uniref:S66 peptidase family protein n=1 Tax=Butyricimonas sp. TaxID=1969738 RepID=UPI0025C5A3C5|nr:LD-carboxypeptidase [Butyricimonas sp.]